MYITYITFITFMKIKNIKLVSLLFDSPSYYSNYMILKTEKMCIGQCNLIKFKQIQKIFISFYYYLFY